MKVSISKPDKLELGLYFLFSEDDYEVEEYHLFTDLRTFGYDGTMDSLKAFLDMRISYRKFEKAKRELEAQVHSVQPDIPSDWSYE